MLALFQIAQMLCSLNEGVSAVKIVRIDHGKVLCQVFACRIDRMGGTPRLGTALGRGKAIWQIVQILESIEGLDIRRNSLANRLGERLVVLFFYDKYNLMLHRKRR